MLTRGRPKGSKTRNRSPREPDMAQLKAIWDDYQVMTTRQVADKYGLSDRTISRRVKTAKEVFGYGADDSKSSETETSA